MRGTSENFEFLRWTSTPKCSSRLYVVDSAFSVSSALKFFVLISAGVGRKKLGIILVLLAVGFLSCGKGAASIYLKKGKEYYRKNNFQMAIKFFDKTLEIDSNSVEAKYYKALCYYGLGHNHHACEEMTNLMKAGYEPADTTLERMGCYYFPADTTVKTEVTTKKR